ncbi:hypothetical protein [Flavobacterium phycosphaerae]|uniref:hypothetical protein n=1 Tax=Flavobacterium phycosphaerae TaxID=2697515 RepID=UPI001389C29D|nr:hypothetical protein [Flavobacterium phycosphaerae]
MILSNLKNKIYNFFNIPKDEFNLNELNDYSLKVYKYLKKHHKELLKNITLEKSNFGKKYILLELKTKNENAAGNLFFETENNELTVGFDSFHSHYDSFAELNIENELKNALENFHKILKDELFVVSAGGGASTLLTKEEIEIIESGKKLEHFNYDCITYYITSWSGKHDRTFKNPN